MKFKLTTKFALSLTILGIILTVLISSVGYYTVKSRLENQNFEMIRNTANTCASMLDGDVVKHFLDEGGNETTAYREMTEILDNFKREGELSWLVLHVSTRDQSTAIYEANIEGDDPADLREYNTIANYAELCTDENGVVDETGLNEYHDMYDHVINHREIESPMITDDKVYGYLYAAYAGIYGSDGELVAVIDASIEMTEVRNSLNQFLFILIGSSTVIIFALIIGYLLVARKLIVNPIVKLSDNVSEFITGGDIDNKPILIRTHDEIEALAGSFNKMKDDLRQYIDNLRSVTAEKERIGAELSVATHIQASMLPCIFPPFPERTEFDIFASMHPAKEVGGDFYDFFLIDYDHLAMVIADVSGKGVPAALFMVIAKTLIKNHAQAGEEPSEIFTNTNKQLCENNEAGMFVTAWMGILEISSGKLTYVNAGHNPPLIKKSNASFEYLKCKPGFVLAGMDTVRYRQNELQLEKGEVLYLYTDGVTEATDSACELFGEARLQDTLCKNDTASPSELLSSVTESINTFVGSAPQFDDITMLAIKINSANTDDKLLTLPAKLDKIVEITDFVDKFLEKHNCNDKAKAQINVAIDEIYSNIARYAYGSNEGNATVKCRYDSKQRAAYITFLDCGMPYDPLKKADPDVTKSAEEREIGGLGIYMVKKSMDDMLYEYSDGMNVLTIKKIIS